MSECKPLLGVFARDHDWLSAREMCAGDYFDIILRIPKCHPPREVRSGPKANDPARVCRRCGTWDCPPLKTGEPA